MTNGYANSTLYWERLRQRMRQEMRVIRWDLRGHGQSGAVRDMETMTVPGCADDLRRVMDAAGVERAMLAGFSFGSQIVLEAWRQFPDRVAGLMPAFGPFERPFDTFLHPAVGPLIFALYRAIPQQLWGSCLKCGAMGSMLKPVHRAAQGLGIVGPTISHEEMAPFYRHLAQLDVPSWYTMGLAAQQHSARDILSDIDVPTLVIAGGSDLFSPGWLGQVMAEQIPDAELVWIEEATHTGLFDASEEVAAAVERFLPRVFDGWPMVSQSVGSDGGRQSQMAGEE